MNYLIDLICLFLWLVAVPLLTGNFLLKRCKVESNPALAYLIGMFFEWAVFEIIAVPCIKIKTSLTLVTVLWCVVMGLTCLLEILGWVRRKEYLAYKQWLEEFLQDCKESTWLCRVLFVLMIFLIGFQMYMYFFYQHTDADDARFIANAVAAWDSDTMLLTHPNTGEILDEPVGELTKDAVSPWMIYIAMLARLVFIHPTILAHTILPVFLVGMGYAAYWLVGKALLKNNWTKIALFVILVCIFNMFGYTSLYTGTTFFLTRIWQGKSVVAGIMVPFIFALMLLMEADYTNKRWNAVVLVVTSASCLLSGMGLIFSALMVGCFVPAYALQNRSLKSLVYGAISCVPNIIFGILYMRT